MKIFNIEEQGFSYIDIVAACHKIYIIRNNKLLVSMFPIYYSRICYQAKIIEKSTKEWLHQNKMKVLESRSKSNRRPVG